MSVEYVTASGYLVIEGVENSYGVLNSAKYVKVTGRLPQMDNNQRAIKLSIKVPKKVFDPIASVAIEIPEGAIIMPEVTIDESLAR